MNTLFVVLSTTVRVPFPYNKSAVTVNENVVARRVASFVKVTNINVSFFAKANASAMRFMCDSRVFTIVTLSVLFYTEFDVTTVVESFQFATPVEKVIRQTVQLLSSHIEC